MNLLSFTFDACSWPIEEEVIDDEMYINEKNSAPLKWWEKIILDVWNEILNYWKNNNDNDLTNYEL